MFIEIRDNSVPNRALLNKGKGTSNNVIGGSTNITNNSQTIRFAQTYQAGENIETFDLVYIDNDLIAYLADATNNKPAHFIAVTTALENELVNVDNCIRLSYENNFTTPLLLLASNGKFDAELSEGTNFIQEIGYVLNEYQLFINIQNAEWWI